MGEQLSAHERQGNLVGFHSDRVGVRRRYCDGAAARYVRAWQRRPHEYAFHDRHELEVAVHVGDDSVRSVCAPAAVYRIIRTVSRAFHRSCQTRSPCLTTSVIFMRRAQQAALLHDAVALDFTESRSQMNRERFARRRMPLSAAY